MIFIRFTRPKQWRVLLLLSLNVIGGFSAEKTYFPSSVKICSAKDQNLNTCFRDSANKMLKLLVRGMPKLNAVPIDPLYVPLMQLKKNNTLVPTLAFNYTDTYHEGWRDAVVTRSEINPKGGEFNIAFRLPRYYIHGRYDITGSISGIPLEGTGDFEFTFYNWTNNMQMKGHLEARRSLEFLVIDDFQQKTHVDKMIVNFHNLFNNSEQSDAANNDVNQKDRAILDEGNGVMNEIFGKIHSGLVQRIFDRVSYRVMFPDLD